MSYEVPEPWASAMLSAGVTDPRNGGRASWQELRRRTGIHVSTLTAMARGDRATKQQVLDTVAEALMVNPVDVAAWVRRTRTVRAPYSPPAEANLLNRDEREAVDTLIRLLAKSKRRDDREGQDDTAPVGASDMAEGVVFGVWPD